MKKPEILNNLDIIKEHYKALSQPSEETQYIEADKVRDIIANLIQIGEYALHVEKLMISTYSHQAEKAVKAKPEQSRLSYPKYLVNKIMKNKGSEN